MKVIEHPSAWLSKQIVEAIRSSSREAESLRQLHPIQLDLIRQEQWLKMFVPKKLGGLELTLPEVLRIEEALAWTDGSTAWVVTLCAGAAWFVGFLNPELAKEIFSVEPAFFAGSGASTGTAEVISDGYRLNGKWKYASGSLHANVFTANFVIHENGKPKSHGDGTPLIRSFVLRQDEVTTHKTWNSIGMIATASHSFEVKNLAVRRERAFDIDSKKIVIDKPTYRYPFLQLAETTLSVNLSGLAIRFIDLFGEANKRASAHHLKMVKRKREKLDAQRTAFYKAVQLSWKSCSKKKIIPKSELKKVSNASHALAKQSLKVVDKLYPHSGLIAADQGEEINRVWRNIHTASQHSLFRH